MKKIYNILIIMIYITNMYAQDQDAKRILDDLSKENKSYTDITIDFSHNFSNNNQQINEDMTGKIWIKGDMYRIDMSNEISVINNGKTQWVIMKDIPEVQIMDNNPDDDWNPSSIFTIYEKGYKYEYKGEANEDNGEISNIINLYPEENTNVIKIELKINKKNNQIISIKRHDKDGGIETYIITRFRKNSSINEQIFQFIKEDYPEIEVIDLR